MTRILSNDLMNFNVVLLKKPTLQDVSYGYSVLVNKAENFKIIDKEFLEILKRRGKEVKVDVLFSMMTTVSVNADVRYLKHSITLDGTVLSGGDEMLKRFDVLKLSTYIDHKRAKGSESYCLDHKTHHDLHLYRYNDDEFSVVENRRAFDGMPFYTLDDNYKYLTRQEMKNIALGIAMSKAKGDVNGSYQTILRLIPVLRVWIPDFKGSPCLFYVNLANFCVQTGLLSFPIDEAVDKNARKVGLQERLLTFGVVVIPLLSLLVFYGLPAILHYPIKDLKLIGIIAFVLLAIGGLVLFFKSKLYIFIEDRERKGMKLRLHHYPKHVFKIILGYLVTIAVPVLLCMFL